MAMPRYSIETITPELAREYLGANTHNRNVRARRIAMYASDMLEGNWYMTGEPIKFASNGTLIDGQHRLLAVIEADTPVTMAVVRGIEALAMDVLDSGAPRTHADALKLRGIANGKDVAAAAQAHAAWKNGRLTTVMQVLSGADRMTHAQTIEYVKQNPELEDAAAFANGMKGTIQLPVGSLATAWVELMAIDPDSALDYFDRLREMRGGGTGEPVSTFLKRLNVERNRGSRIAVGTGLYMLFRTWNALVSGEPLNKFMFGVPGAWVQIPTPHAAASPKSRLRVVA